MTQATQYNKRSIVLSVIFHVIAFLVLFGNVTYQSFPKPTVKKAPVVVEAVALDQEQVQAEIDNIQAKERAKKQAVIQRENELKRLEKKVKLERIKEEKRLSDLRIQSKKLEQKRAKEQKEAKEKLTQIKKQQEAENKRLLDLKEKNEVGDKNAEASKSSSQIGESGKTLHDRLFEQRFSSEEKLLRAANQGRIQREIDKYSVMIINKVGQNWIIPKNINKTLKGEVLVRLAPGGLVLDAKLTKPSGNLILDRSVLKAIQKASPLPVPSDSVLFEACREIHIRFSPEGLLN